MPIYQQGNSFSDLPFSAEQLQRDIGKLQSPEPPIKPLTSPATPKPLRDKTAVAVNTPSAEGGGISSPLTETDIASRTYWDGKVITSSDGLLVWPAPKEIVFTDADGREVVMVMAEPA